jgi:hypothetical protein
MWARERDRNAPSCSSSSAQIRLTSDLEIVDLPRGDPVDVGLHDHGEQGTVDPAPTLQDGGEEAALAELRDLQIHVPGLGRQQPVPGAVPLGGPGVCPLEAVGPDPSGRLRINQGLEHQGHALAHDVDVAASADGGQQFVEVSIGDGHWVVLLG